MSEESVESIFQHACEGAAESIGSTRANWQSVVDAIRELRGRLASSEAALQEAQRSLFRWLPNRIGSEYDDLIAADAMSLMGLESTEGLREIGGEILIELLEKRRLLDEARAQKPVELECYDAGFINDFGGGDVDWWRDYMRCELSRAHDFYQSQVYAAPVPAQPAAEITHCANCGKPLTFSSPGNGSCQPMCDRPTVVFTPERHSSGREHSERPAGAEG